MFSVDVKHHANLLYSPQEGGENEAGCMEPWLYSCEMDMDKETEASCEMDMDKETEASCEMDMDKETEARWTAMHGLKCNRSHPCRHHSVQEVT